ncbi:MAG: aspartate aminotransferase family protein [Chloroflexota bacterium]
MTDDLAQRALRVFPGGHFGGFKPQAAWGLEVIPVRGEGSRVFDHRGREYVDYILGSGPLILGHAHPAVVEAVRRQAALGSTFYMVNEPAIELAEAILSALPAGWALRYCNSGAEATNYALRLARAFTGREKILRFAGGYHGHQDYTIGEASAGIPRAVKATVLVAPFNDLEVAQSLIEAHAGELAAVIVEPLQRVIPPVGGFLEGLRAATARHGVLLIFDEVVTGFRLAFGGAAEYYGVIPDLATYGKIIGGGYPLAAVAGRKEILDLTVPGVVEPERFVFLSGTLNGNPVACAAGLATLKELRRPGVYERLHGLGLRLRAGFAEVARRRGVALQVLGDGPLAGVYFSSEPIRDQGGIDRSDRARLGRLNAELLRAGILVNLSAKFYISLAHTEADLDRTLEAFDQALAGRGSHGL